MDAFLAAIEQWPYARFLKTNFIAYPLVSALHILSIGALLTSVGLMHLRLAGFVQSLPSEAFVGLLRRVAIIAFACAALSGLSLFSVKAGDYAASPLFLTKLAIIVAATVNFLAFAAVESRQPAGVDRPLSLKLMAVLSIGLWLAALFCGRMLGFV